MRKEMGRTRGESQRHPGSCPYYDAFALQETHIRQQGLSEVEAKLSVMGMRSCFAAARSSRSSETGTHGGVMVGVRSFM